MLIPLAGSLHAVSVFVYVHSVSEKTCHFIFSGSLNKNCRITVIFGTLIANY